MAGGFSDRGADSREPERERVRSAVLLALRVVLPRTRHPAAEDTVAEWGQILEGNRIDNDYWTYHLNREHQ